MTLNIPGVVMMVVFYVLILGTGLWGARKSRNAERSSSGDRTAVVLLGDRRISLVIGIFTMTGMCAGCTQVYIYIYISILLAGTASAGISKCLTVFARKVCVPTEVIYQHLCLIF